MPMWNRAIATAGPARRTRRGGQPPTQGRGGQRRGVAAVEFAVLLPLLMLLFVLATDFSRVYYSAVTTTNCARNGALYASDPKAAVESPYASVSEAALADATNLSPQPTVASQTGTDDLGQPYVDVTVTYTFQSVSGYLGSAGNVKLVRTVRTAVAPTVPD
jgi:Flp pilus assembly protein TadG